MIELLVACVILIFVVSATVTSFVSMKQISRNMGYHYIAMNLAKEPLEFGEAGSLAHKFAMKYYYPPATTNTIPESFTCGVDGIANTAGYALKEWRCFSIGNPYPFDPALMGDIKARGLVPSRAPDSVQIYYYADTAPGFVLENRATQIFGETVEVSWQDEEGGETRKEVVSVVPIRSVNDQLMLLTSEFWWE